MFTPRCGHQRGRDPKPGRSHLSKGIPVHTITRTAGSAALDVEQVKKDATWMAERIQASIDEINKELIDSTTIGRLHNVMALAHAYSQGNPYAGNDEPAPSESSMWLVYADTEGGKHYQPWQDLEESGTLIDPETGEDMEMIGWTTNPPGAGRTIDGAQAHQWARCNECGSEVIFDAYVDYAGDVSEVFDNTVCTGCCAESKYGNFTLVPGYPEDETSDESASPGGVRSDR